MRQYQEKLRKYEDQLREWQKKPEGEVPKPPPLPDPLDHSALPAPEDGERPSDLLRDFRPGSDQAPRERIEEGRMVIRDHDGEMRVTLKEGRRALTITAPNGDQVFSGPMDTPEQRQAVPQQYRRKLEALEVRERRDSSVPPGESQHRAERPTASEIQ
jgi:hypothetical protein